ncbi:hypothetical protein A3F00_05150 [Candidatus Daviesbacteria bacterium RIFCSPHIGHO2_12_FULL_37_11]|uniref:TVP38/TMEM64 family membrane protein n=1 Tax=Candidatus Daviesbacteria bacterium RIFCSPHIGHO2_12_FULL_37_11 TaxID=1797777 RepID=A0A1F5K9Q7_9BACT|nr:MAG: hypothetical protein A3F00_05150 [Candidatus Daviesbacteria bacterium RIFCSPHIGHO2_12_FULL_37_11]OGE46326.1 MAG: hypothetical protein A3B39_03115 [Candidatus Daviesbacteria bacterium RIFCSPLOWO2_01_FULL_37_10]
MIKKALSILLIGAPLAFLIIFSMILQVTVLSNPEIFTSWLSQFGPFVILIYVLVQSLSVIIAPIGGFFIQVALVALFPKWLAFVILYLTVTPLYMINFYIARKYGRPIVKNLIGSKALEKVDHLAKDLGISSLIILKIFQGMYFDYISYAVGLTQVKAKTFIIVNILGGIPATFISYFVVTRFSNFALGMISWVIVSYILLALSILINHQIKKHKRI